MAALLFGIKGVSDSVTNQARYDAKRFAQLSGALTALGVDHVHSNDSDDVYEAVSQIRRGFTIEGGVMDGEMFIMPVSINRARRASPYLTSVSNEGPDQRPPRLVMMSEE